MAKKYGALPSEPSLPNTTSLPGVTVGDADTLPTGWQLGSLPGEHAAHGLCDSLGVTAEAMNPSNTKRCVPSDPTAMMPFDVPNMMLLLWSIVGVEEVAVAPVDEGNDASMVTLPSLLLMNPPTAALVSSWRNSPQGRLGTDGPFDPPPEHAASTTARPSASRKRIPAALVTELRKTQSTVHEMGRAPRGHLREKGGSALRLAVPFAIGEQVEVAEAVGELTAFEQKGGILGMPELLLIAQERLEHDRSAGDQGTLQGGEQVSLQVPDIDDEI